MSHYGVVYPEFWTGPTGKSIRKAGGRDAQLLALYLVSCRHATMIGLFYMPFDVMQQETGLTARALVRALELLREPCRFASYDPQSEVVWVYEMARFRVLGPTPKKALEKDDNRVPHCQRLYAEVVENPFLEAFHVRYRDTLRLGSRRTGDTNHQMSPLPRGFQAPSKPVDRSVRTETGTGTGTGTGNRKITALARGGAPRGNRMLKALVFREVEAGIKAGDTTLADLTERVKVAVARAHVPYNDGRTREFIHSTITTATKRIARAGARR